MATKPLDATMATTAATEATTATTEVVATKATKPSRGRGGKNNFPQSTAGISGAAVSVAIEHVMAAFKMPKVQNDAELIARQIEYFEQCRENGAYPTVEGLALYCGYTRSHFWEIEAGKKKGFTTETANIIKKGKEFIAAIDAEMVNRGDMNFTTYIFRSKNYYGLRDQVDHILTTGTADDYSRDDIASRYMIDGGDGEA